jgi:competence protein ComGC
VTPTDAADDLAGRLLCALEHSGMGRLLLIVDPLGDVVTGQQQGDTGARFARAVADVIIAPPPQVHIVAVIRSDHVPALQKIVPDVDALQARTLDVPELTPEDIRRAIEAPAERVGLALEPGLVDRILSELREEPSPLALLQVVLPPLWERRRDGWLTNTAYDSLGGVRGILAQRAEQLYLGLPSAQQQAVRRIGLRLVRPGAGAEFIRATVPLAEVTPQNLDGGAPDASSIALRALIEHRLVRVTQQELVSCARLAHDGLLRDWDRFREWLNDERAFLLWRDRLRVSLEQWTPQQTSQLLLSGAALTEASYWKRDRGEALTPDEQSFIESSERHRNRRWRFTAFTLVAMTIVSLLLAAFVAVLWNNAEKAREQGVQAQQKAWAEMTKAQEEREAAQTALQAEKDARAREHLQAKLALDTIETLRQSEAQLRQLVDQRTAASDKQRRALQDLQRQIDTLSSRAKASQADVLTERRSASQQHAASLEK